ncbi:fumarate hydratase [bacterium]|nr:fumarate hydratase [bacterium]
MKKQIDLKDVEDQLYQAIGRVGIEIDPAVKRKLTEALAQEKNTLAQDILSDLLLNGQVAHKLQKPLCQDTGLAVFFVEIGYDLHLPASLEKTINSAVARAYQDFYFRKSMVNDPLFHRINTSNNLPAIIHWSFNQGDKLKISFSAKGGGSENMSRLKMLKPSDGVQGVKDFVLKTVIEANGNPCPPIIVGIGVGGNFESCAILAKKALFRDLDDNHPEEEWAALEQDILQEINKTNIGPQGLGGDTSALAVKIEYLPCHIASLPLAVNIQCHSHRHFTLEF